jgi:hypothetical protein
MTRPVASKAVAAASVGPGGFRHLAGGGLFDDGVENPLGRLGAERAGHGVAHAAQHFRLARHRPHRSIESEFDSSRGDADAHALGKQGDDGAVNAIDVAAVIAQRVVAVFGVFGHDGLLKSKKPASLAGCGLG